MLGYGERLKAMREKAGLTQSELGKMVGITGVAIMRYEKEQREPTLNQLQAIAAALNADIIYLISGQTTAEVENGILIQAEAEAKAEFEKLQLELRNKLYDERVSLSSALIRLFKLFRSLNSMGHQKAIERVEELTEIPRYKATEPPQTPPAPQEGRDTDPAPDGAEGPPEGK